MNTYSKSSLTTTIYLPAADTRLMDETPRCSGIVRTWVSAAFLLIGLALIAASCRSAPPPPKPEVVTLTEHVMIVQPGDTVPSLPEGQSIWYLATPRGLASLLPADAPILRVEEEP